MNEEKVDQKRQGTGIRWRIAATCGLLFLCVVSTVRFASGAFEAESVPVADISAQNGIVTGTLRMMGNRFLLYNGTRLESMAESMEVNFERGGSMVLCPRSQLQILGANGNAGMMLAFASGGAQQPFPIQMGDEVLTPDWRVELTSDARTGDMGVVQIVTNRHGNLCLQGNSLPGAYFRVSQLTGDASFHVEGNHSERFSDGKMESSNEACGCDDATLVAKADPASPIPAISEQPADSSAQTNMPSTFALNSAAVAALSGRSAETPAAKNSAEQAVAHQPEASGSDSRSIKSQPRSHPEDVAGYVRSFVHLIFGR
jgi:hypothetical protein